MNTAVARSETAQQIIERVLAVGDLSKLTVEERNKYYLATCDSLGLNPLTRPFEYTNLSGKLVLYARKDCAEQLRKLHNISLTIAERSLLEGVYTVVARAEEKETGRTDEDLGVVTVGQLRGEFLANAMLKAVTKAKRRVTLSICGLGFPDESDVEEERKLRRREPVDHTRPQPARILPVDPPPEEPDEVADDLKAYEERISGQARFPQPGDRPREDLVAGERDAVEMAQQRFPLVRITGELVDAADFEDWYLKIGNAVRSYMGERLRKLIAMNEHTILRLAEDWPEEIDALRALVEQKLGA